MTPVARPRQLTSPRRRDGTPSRWRRARILAVVAALGAVCGVGATALGPEPVAALDWNVTGPCGTTQATTVPEGFRHARILLVAGGGGQGGSQFTGSGGTSRGGDQVSATVEVTPGQTVSVVVGCRGADGSAAPNAGPTPGWSTGGGAGIGSTSVFEGGASGGAGGGATGLCIGSATCAPGSPTLVMVAGGGGGGGTTNCSTVDSNASRGGAGGDAVDDTTASGGGRGPSGGSGSTSSGPGGPGGRNVTAGPADGAASANGSGGAGVNVVGGGGGGGYVGGAAGIGASTGCVGGGGGGGGSSWVVDDATDVEWAGSVWFESGQVQVRFIEPSTTTLASSVNPSAVGESVTFTATITAEGAPVTYGNVDFTSDAGPQLLGQSVRHDGTAVFTTSALPEGTHTVTATWTGRGYESSSAAVVQVVGDPSPPEPAVTVTSVASSVNPSVVGEEVTFTASVTSGGVSVTEGTVDLEVGSLLHPGLVPDGAGRVSVSTTALPEGTTTVTATFGGTSAFAGSSGSVVQVVEVAEPPEPAVTVTSVASSANPSVVGEEVTFTASVTSGGVPVTEGTVDLDVVATGSRRAAIPLDPDGTVTVTVPDLAEGTHVVTASFSGAPGLAPSTATIEQVVEPAAPRPTDPPGPPSTPPPGPGLAGPTPTPPPSSGPAAVAPPRSPGSATPRPSAARSASAARPDGGQGPRPLARTGAGVTGVLLLGSGLAVVGLALCLVADRTRGALDSHR